MKEKARLFSRKQETCLNLKRRHLDESQRAMVAARLANLHDGQREDYASRTGSSIELPVVSQHQAAELLNVGVASLKRAKDVQQHSVPSLIAAVDAGIVAVSTAADIATLPQPEQEEIVARGEAEILAVAKRLRTHRAQFTGEQEWYTCGRALSWAHVPLKVAIENQNHTMVF